MLPNWTLIWYYSIGKVGTPYTDMIYKEEGRKDTKREVNKNQGRE